MLIVSSIVPVRAFHYVSATTYQPQLITMSQLELGRSKILITVLTYCLATSRGVLKIMAAATIVQFCVMRGDNGTRKQVGERLSDPCACVRVSSATIMRVCCDASVDSTDSRSAA